MQEARRERSALRVVSEKEGKPADGGHDPLVRAVQHGAPVWAAPPRSVPRFFAPQGATTATQSWSGVVGCPSRSDSGGVRACAKRAVRRRVGAAPHLLGLEPNAARRIVRRHDGRVLLGAPVSHDRLTAPEDVGGVVDLLFLHARAHVIVLDDDACGRDAGGGTRGRFR